MSDFFIPPYSMQDNVMPVNPLFSYVFAYFTF